MVDSHGVIVVVEVFYSFSGFGFIGINLRVYDKRFSCLALNFQVQRFGFKRPKIQWKIPLIIAIESPIGTLALGCLPLTDQPRALVSFVKPRIVKIPCREQNLPRNR